MIGVQPTGADPSLRLGDLTLRKPHYQTGPARPVNSLRAQHLVASINRNMALLTLRRIVFEISHCRAGVGGGTCAPIGCAGDPNAASIGGKQDRSDSFSRFFFQSLRNVMYLTLSGCPGGTSRCG
jgi:hypothetical protein